MSNCIARGAPARSGGGGLQRLRDLWSIQIVSSPPADVSVQSSELLASDLFCFCLVCVLRGVHWCLRSVCPAFLLWMCETVPVEPHQVHRQANRRPLPRVKGTRCVTYWRAANEVQAASQHGQMTTTSEMTICSRCCWPLLRLCCTVQPRVEILSSWLFPAAE